jgi:hypothetical protein
MATNHNDFFGTQKYFWEALGRFNWEFNSVAHTNHNPNNSPAVKGFVARDP